MTTAIDDDNCLVFGPRSKACPSWPVRVAGMQGLWRYIGPLNPETVEVVGPYFPNNPSRNGGRSRIFKIDVIKYPGKHAKPIDVLNVQATDISMRAQRRR